jgi:hypothetical protein
VRAELLHSSALAFAKGTKVHADEAAAWDHLHERFEVKRINHQEAHSLDGACTNQAEEYFSRGSPDRHSRRGGCLPAMRTPERTVGGTRQRLRRAEIAGERSSFSITG